MTTIAELKALAIEADAMGDVKTASSAMDKIEAMQKTESAPAMPKSAAAKFATDFMAVPRGIYRGVQDVSDTLLKGGASAIDAITGTSTRKAVDAETQRQKAAYDTDYENNPMAGTGRLAGNVGITLPVGGAFAVGAKALGAAAPIVNALGSFGMSTGVKAAPGAVSMLGTAATRAGAGAVTSGVASGLIGQDAESGAYIGAALPFAGSALVRGGGYVKDLVTGQRGNISAAKLAQDVAGTSAPEIKAALAAAKDNQTAGQALVTAGKGNEEFLALADAAAKRGNPNTIAANNIADSKPRRLLLAKLAGGDSQEASLLAQRETKKGISQNLDPMRVEGANAANTTTEFISGLKTSTADALASAKQSVENARKFNLAGQKASETGSNVTKPIWMPRSPLAAKDQYIAGDLSKRAEQAVTDAAGNSLIAGRSAAYGEKVLAETEARGLAELSAAPLYAKITSLKNSRGDSANPIVTNTLTGLEKYLGKFVDDAGNINAYDLHGIRKNVSNIVDMIYPAADAGVKARAAVVIGKLVPTIDEGINAAGGQKLTQYFEKFSNGMRQVDKMKLFNAAQGMSDKELVSLVRGNSPEIVEQIFGQGNISVKSIMGRQYDALNSVASGLERNSELAARGSAEPAQRELARIIAKNTSRVKAPAWFDAKLAAANLVLGKAEARANEKMLRIAYEAMQKPSDALKLLNTLPTSQRSEALKILLDPKLAVPARTMMTGEQP